MVIRPLVARSEAELQAVFSEDVLRLGGGQYRGWMTLTAGGFGTSTFPHFAFHPRTMLDLALLVEYAEDHHHDCLVMIMRRPKESHHTPTALSMSEHGHWLDDINNPFTAPINAVNNPEHFDQQAQIVAEWTKVRQYIDRLEIENRELRSRLNS
jgi:hypothetical protein